MWICWRRPSASIRACTPIASARTSSCGCSAARKLRISCRGPASARPKQEGQLRSDVCAVAAFFAHCGAKNAAILGCTGSALPAAVKATGVRALTCICPDRATARLIENKVSGTRAYEGSSGYTDLADASQSAVLMYLPVKAEKTERLESDLRNALFETRRVLEPEGRIVVIAALHHAESTLRKTQGVRGARPLSAHAERPEERHLGDGNHPGQRRRVKRGECIST